MLKKLTLYLVDVVGRIIKKRIIFSGKIKFIIHGKRKPEENSTYINFTMHIAFCTIIVVCI